MVFRALMMILVGGVLGACDKPPTVATVAGTYVGSYGGGTETIMIRADSTFIQVFVQGKKQVYSNSGKWRIDGDDIIFEPFTAAFDFSTHSSTLSPQHYDISRGLWDAMYPRIVFSDDLNYWVIKQKRASKGSQSTDR